jgi:hypothetical protein
LYSIGDKVRVKINADIRYGWYREWEGKIMTIESESDDGSYYGVAENPFSWLICQLESPILDEEMFEI